MKMLRFFRGPPKRKSELEERLDTLEEALVQLSAGYMTVVQILQKLHIAVLMQQKLIEDGVSTSSGGNTGGKEGGLKRAKVKEELH